MDCLKISVVTPSYNQGKFLEGTILSVLNQSYPHFEYIIMDGGSTDNSVEIIKKYSDKLTYWQSKPDGGQSAAINEGFRHATGDILCWLNSDDQFAAETLNTVSKYFLGHHDCQWLSGISQIKDQRGKLLETIIPKKLNFKSLAAWYNNIIYQPATFWRKELWENVGGLNERLNCSMDFDLWLKFSKITEGHRIEKILATALRHKNMKTKQMAHESFIETALVLSQYGEFEKAKKLLSRPIKRAFEIDNTFKFITRNSLYRKWREAKELKKK